MQEVIESPAAELVRAQVRRMLQQNLKQGHDHALNVDFSYIRPSPGSYESQWFWDSCLHAVAAAHVDPELAQLELETLIATQRDDGSIGHMHVWGNKLRGMWSVVALGQSNPSSIAKGTALIGPPLLAQAVERVGQVTKDAMFAPRFMARLDRYHEWLAENRAPDGDGLLVIVSPDEAGATRSPAMDDALGFRRSPTRFAMGLKDYAIDAKNWFTGYDSKELVGRAGFLMKDALVNGVYAESLATMARMHRQQGNENSAHAYEAMAERVTQSMLDKLLDRGVGGFMSLAGREERRVLPSTVGSLVPLVMPSIPQEIVDELVERHLMRRDKFWLPYPIPSVAANEETFDPRQDKMSWRGPTWISTNWLVWRGLTAHGHHEVAGHLATRTLDMVAEHGLRQFYNPFSGQGMGAHSYGQSALALDMATFA